MIFKRSKTFETFNSFISPSIQIHYLYTFTIILFIYTRIYIHYHHRYLLLVVLRELIFLVHALHNVFCAILEIDDYSYTKTQSTEPLCSLPLMNSTYNLDSSRILVKSRISSLSRIVIISILYKLFKFIKIYIYSEIR